MQIPYPTDDISFASLKKDAAHYSLEKFRQDIFAGLSVALLAVPQAMAYALLAGLPASCGLLAVIYSAIIAALFGSSRHLVVGPSNAIAILLQSGTTAILYTYYRDLPVSEWEGISVQILTQLTLLTALIQMFAAWCRLGRLIHFVSSSVVIGYISGATLAVIINQLFPLLGITRPTGLHSLYEHGIYLLSHIYEAHWLTMLIGGGSIALLITLKRLNKNIPAALIVLAIMSLVVEGLGLSSYSQSSWLANFYSGDKEGTLNVLVVGDTSDISLVIPTIAFPSFDFHLMNGVLPFAVVLALLSVMETVSVAKSIAANSGQRLSINQEIFGIGLGNIVSAFIGGMPVSGSTTRSCLNYSNGAQTRFAAVLSALFVALAVFLLGFVVTRIPLATLAAMLLITALSIVNTKHLLMCLYATNADAFVLWATLSSCLFFSLDIAFYIGVALSVTLYLKKAAVPQLVEYEIDDNGELRNIDPLVPTEPRAIRVIKVEGELFFGAADLFQNTLKAIAEDDTSTKVIILQLKNARDIDATACLALQQLHEYLQRTGRHLIACGLTTQVWEVLNNSGLVEQVGCRNMFTFDERHPHLHMQQAFQLAKLLVSQDSLPKTPELFPQIEALPVFDSL